MLLIYYLKLEYVIELKGSKCPYDTTMLAARFLEVSFENTPE